MKNKILSLLICLFLLVGIIPISVSAEVEKSDDIVILYENDVHCSVDGYSRLSAMKKELQGTHNYVGAVSCGDYIQGSSLGSASRGEYIVELMNLVGYDAVTLGNHEFDFRISRLDELVDMMYTKPVCCNFQKIGEDESYFEPYSMVSYGEVDIAYVGITTPTTITTASPTQFKDENGEYTYTFNQSDLYDVVQGNIDAAKAAGADYVIALSHIGYADDAVYGDLEDVEDLIRNTNGFDVVLDGHSHSVIEEMEITDKGGNEVLLTSTGTKFEYIGKLTISDGEFKSELIKVEDYTATDPIVDAHIQTIMDEFSEIGNRKVGYSEYDLVIQDPDGNRLVRVAETNLGDLCADAFRYATEADISFMNGGGLRAGISAGDVTFNNLMNVLPFNNTIVLARVSGQTIKDMLEMAMIIWPKENGAFPHVSGITFSVNTSISSSVVLSEEEEFIGVDGEYRVYDIKVFNRETGAYEPIVLTDTYTMAASNFYLIDHGSGMSMLSNAEILQNEGTLDVEVLERYITEVLGGTIGEEYSVAKPNITFTEVDNTPDDENKTPDNEDNTPDNEIATPDSTSKSSDSTDKTTIIICTAAGSALALAVIVFIIKRR